MSTKTLQTPNWEKAQWAHYDYIFYTNRTRADRKSLLRKLVACGLTAWQAVKMVRDYEVEP